MGAAGVVALHGTLLRRCFLAYIGAMRTFRIAAPAPLGQFPAPALLAAWALSRLQLLTLLLRPARN
jgi:hypothetical protein